MSRGGSGGGGGARGMSGGGMARGMSGGRSAPRPAARDSLRNPPQPAPVQGGNGSVAGGLGSTIAEGMGFGTGSAIGRRVVDFLMGPRVIQHETVVSSTSAAPTPTPTIDSIEDSDACGTHAKAFQDCLNSSGSDVSKCQSYMDMLSECRRKSGA